MKSPLLLLALATLLTAPAFAEKPEPKKPAAPAPAAPTTPPAAGKTQDVTPEEVEKLLKERKDVIVLDVRTPAEFEMGHIAGAKNVNFLDDDFAKMIAEFHGKPVVIHCAAGNRSARAVQSLKEKDFVTIYHLTGGYKAWVDAGKPVTGEAKLVK